jgi:hypothetical protein
MLKIVWVTVLLVAVPQGEPASIPWVLIENVIWSPADRLSRTADILLLLRSSSWIHIVLTPYPVAVPGEAG